MSAILSVDDLNDFISPGVACIKPIETLPLQKPDEQNPYEVTTEDKLLADNPPPPAQISLTDCLACSGCVTSAEAVLISLQSHAEVLNALDSGSALDVALLLRPDLRSGVAVAARGKIFVASVSPQVRASLAATYNVSEREAGWMIEQLLAGPHGLASGGKFGNGFTWVVDTNAMREASLVLGADELRDSLTNAKPFDAHGDEGSASRQSQRPILSSACPGWICYVEKTHPHVLPHLSRLKSPQALTGTMLKSVLHAHLGIRPDQVWHVAVMPCFDKKLEASRPELMDTNWRTLSTSEINAPVRDVDCVITARELLMLADSRGISFPALPRRPLPLSSGIPFPDPIISSFLFHRGSRQLRSRTQTPAAGTSGGYLHHILATQQALHPGSTLTTTRGRNADVLEYAITPAGESSPVFQAARYYGFRNIQNLVRKLKPARRSRFPASAGGRRQTGLRDSSGAGSGGTNSGLAYAYVEVMACPGGCTNGGGQIKSDEIGVGLGLTAKEWVQKVDEAYFSMEEEEEDEEDEEDGGEKSHCDETNGLNYTFNNDRDSKDTNHNIYNHHSDDPNLQPASSCSDDYHKDKVQPAEPTTIDDDGNGNHNNDLIIINGIRPARIHAILAHWAHITGVDLDRLVRTGYRGVESDVGKTRGGSGEGGWDSGGGGGGVGGRVEGGGGGVSGSRRGKGSSGAGDTVRVAELAAKIGGGW